MGRPAERRGEAEARLAVVGVLQHIGGGDVAIGALQALLPAAELAHGLQGRGGWQTCARAANHALEANKYHDEDAISKQSPHPQRASQTNVDH